MCIRDRFVGYAGIAYAQGMSIYFWWAVNIALATALASVTIIPRWPRLRRALGIESPTEYLQMRYNRAAQPVSYTHLHDNADEQGQACNHLHHELDKVGPQVGQNAADGNVNQRDQAGDDNADPNGHTRKAVEQDTDCLLYTSNVLQLHILIKYQ